MSMLIAFVGLVLVFGVLWDAFETVVLPRRVSRRTRLTWVFYTATWAPARVMARRIEDDDRRESLLSFYGPLSLILLLAVWALILVLGFALVQWGLGNQVQSDDGVVDFGTMLYYSGTTFFTLGLGDVRPVSGPERAVTVAEVGTGFAFLALVIGYVPVLYQNFSNREIHVSMLDERAGSPPTALGLLRRHQGGETSLETVLRDWERWSAELLESHLSYPVLGFFRSQHDNQSWVAALTMVLDVCALVLVGLRGVTQQQARFTFAIARHAAADLSQVFGVPPSGTASERLGDGDLDRLRAELGELGIPLADDPDAETRLAALRGTYEPYVAALASRLLMALPPWVPDERQPDNWETTAWGAISQSTLPEAWKHVGARELADPERERGADVPP